jgi:hypothetical protein
VSDRRGRTDDGTAVVEFLVLGVLLLVPLLYLALAASAVQRSVYGVTQAAREAGRAYATGSAATAAVRAEAAAELALGDQGLRSTGVEVRYGPADADCAAARPEPWPLAPDAVFAVCVTRRLELPAIPGALAGSGTTVTGRYVVHADPHRDYGDPAGIGGPGAGGVAGRESVEDGRHAATDREAAEDARHTAADHEAAEDRAAASGQGP